MAEWPAREAVRDSSSLYLASKETQEVADTSAIWLHVCALYAMCVAVCHGIHAEEGKNSSACGKKVAEPTRGPGP